MENYIEIFKKLFQGNDAQVRKMRFQETESWDSVGHMNLISRIEDTFDIMFDTEDIIEFDSFEKGVEILKRYDVEL